MQNNRLEERRAHIRYQLKLRARLVLESGQEYAGYLKDISLGGTYLLCQHTVTEQELNSIGNVTVFTLQDEFSGSCKLVRIGSDGIGLLFKKISPQQLLKDLIKDVEKNI